MIHRVRDPDASWKVTWIIQEVPFIAVVKELVEFCGDERRKRGFAEWNRGINR